MVTTLPIEVLESILNQLADSKPDLHVCTLVCRLWAPRSRALLFHSLSTCPSSPAHLSEPFLKTIHQVQSSHLAFLVKSIKVDCCHVSELTRITFNTLRLEHLTRLWLCRSDFARFDRNICLTRALTSSLDTLILDRAVFKDSAQLLHFLSSPCFSNLHSLSLTNISYLLRRDTSTRNPNWILRSWSESTFLELPISPKIMLKELEIGLIPDHNIFDILYHSDSPFDWTCLQKITFYRIWDNGLIQGFLNGLLPALKCIELEKTEHMYHFASSGAFTGVIQNPFVLRNLTELSAAFAFVSSDFLFFENVVKEIQNSSGSRLSTINLILPIDLDGLDIHKAEPSARILNGFTVISDLASLPLLKRVSLIVPISTGIVEQKKADIRNFIDSHSCTAGSISVVFKQAVSEREPFPRLDL
ncbi:hypothetical protein DFJ43DRAFT_1069364 [Lentinula guzmanii]|uniref:F-box domain-containing protein n=1 Tax=Lentinula guzmanii TaxID=2804957 RepID=A0AA38N1N9_9AGAR|nr:hypothetical protein DFJ43DRAFT_1069364 [Lentinula guzmanii]